MKFSTILLLVIPTILSSFALAQGQAFTELIRKLNSSSSSSSFLPKRMKYLLLVFNF